MLVHLDHVHSNVKPLMFACPLFHEFRKTNKTAKLNGANIDAIPIVIGIGVANLQLAHRQTTGCSTFIYVYTTGSNVQVMVQQSQ